MMRQKLMNQTYKKTFILYKSRTGWRVRSRVFGGLLIGFAAFTLADSNHVTPVRAATETPTSTITKQTAPVTKVVNLSKVSAATPAADQTQVYQAPTMVGKQAVATSAPVEKAPVAGDATTTQQPVAEQAAVTPATTQPTYPVLSQSGAVNIGADTSEVNLSADQIASHFTAKVENRGNSDQDDDPADNTVTKKIGADGTIALTSNESHDYYESPGYKTSVTGHQSAHVSFEHEIDFSHGFSMAGALGIGSKDSGADSVGFIFAPGDPAKATQGGSGGQLGLGGLDNAFGFVYDEYNNQDQYNDPSANPYVGWRTTDANGKLQRAAQGDWKSADQVGLNNRHENPLTKFTMDYNPDSQMLTVTFGNSTFNNTFPRRIEDVSTGYSLSVAASTGGSWNDYSAQIDRFSYTPKTIKLGVTLADAADKNAPLDQTKVQAIANIGDTVSVFSTQAAAQRAVANGEVDPTLVSVLPTDTAGNVYVVDGDQAGAGGTVHYVGGDAYRDISDGAYYTYQVTDGDDQAVTVPVRLAFTAEVTPVDAQTKEPIAGLSPVTVTAVAGKPTLIAIPGYTTTKVVLATPATGEKVAHDQLAIDQTTAAATTTTTDTQAEAIGHYYTGTSKTVDGQAVTVTGHVGTGQDVAQQFNTQPLQDAKGNAVKSGNVSAITGQDYTWSSAGKAAATDATTADQAKTTASVLVPTATTLDYWYQQASDNQKQADAYKAQAQALYDEFMKLEGLSAGQKKDAADMLAGIAGIYTNVHDSNATAMTNFQAAKPTTETAALTSYNDGQAGYAALKVARNLLVNFKADLDKLHTTNEAARSSLATINSWTVNYGCPNTGLPGLSLGKGYGGVKADAVTSADFTYFEENQPETAVVPHEAGRYIVKMTDAGRAYLRSLAPDNPNAGLFVSGMLTIKALPVTVQAGDATIGYGDNQLAVTGTYTSTDGITPTIRGGYGNIDDHPATSDFEFVDQTTKQVVPVDQLQKGTYTVQYTAAAQATLKKNTNYQITAFKTGTLTVTPRAITVDAENHSKTYGDKNDPELTLTLDSDSQHLVNQDNIDSLGVHLTRTLGETAGNYAISENEKLSKLNPNYDITVTPGVFTIAKRPVTVSVAPNLRKTYGDADPNLTLTWDTKSQPWVTQDIVDKLGVQLTRVQGENVGNYTISEDIKLSKLNPNYDVTVTSGTLTIKPADLTIQIDKSSKTYGQRDPDFTWHLKSGEKLAFNDPVSSLKVTLNRADGEDVNATGYAITGTSANVNYGVTFQSGKMTITPASAQIKIVPPTVTYGDQSTIDGPLTVINQPALRDQFKQLSPEDFELVDVQGRVVPTKGLAAGSYAVRLTARAIKQLAIIQPNYDFKQTVFGRLTVAPQEITVTVVDQKTYAGQPAPQNEAKVTAGQLRDGDTLAALKLTFTTPDNPAVGVYPIQAKADNPNYQVHVIPGWLTVIGRTSDALGDVTTTEKDVAGDVVNITQTWPDHETTVYTYDPTTGTAALSELIDGKVVKTTSVKRGGETTLVDATGAITVLDAQDLTQPLLRHYPAVPRQQPAIEPTDGPAEGTLPEQPTSQEPVVGTEGRHARVTRQRTTKQLKVKTQKSRKNGTTQRLTTLAHQEDGVQQRSGVQRLTRSTVAPTATATTQAGQQTVTRLAAKKAAVRTKLPQTGEHAQRTLKVLGLALLALGLLPIVRRWTK